MKRDGQIKRKGASREEQFTWTADFPRWWSSDPPPCCAVRGRGTGAATKCLLSSRRRHQLVVAKISVCTMAAAYHRLGVGGGAHHYPLLSPLQNGGCRTAKSEDAQQKVEVTPQRQQPPYAGHRIDPERRSRRGGSQIRRGGGGGLEEGNRILNGDGNFDRGGAWGTQGTTDLPSRRMKLPSSRLLGESESGGGGGVALHDGVVDNEQRWRVPGAGVEEERNLRRDGGEEEDSGER